MIIKRKSPLTGKINILDINVTLSQMNKWDNGELIQNVMPDLTDDEREFIMTGMTAEDWDYLFGKDGEDSFGEEDE